MKKYPLHVDDLSEEDLEEYVAKGSWSARNGYRRSDNPYHFRTEKAHKWDDGWVEYSDRKKQKTRKK